MSNLPPAGLQTRLLRILHRAFVQARNLALAGDSRQLYELADTFEILPELMMHWDDATLDRVRAILAEYEAGHPQCGYEYVSLLEGDDSAFESGGNSDLEPGEQPRSADPDVAASA
jgi:hypothetical protein